MKTSSARAISVTVALILSVATSQLHAQDPGKSYTKVLLPIVLREPLPGLQGSMWTTELTLLNTSILSASVYPFFVNGPFCNECGSPLVPPNSTLSPMVPSAAPPLRGTFLYIDRDRLRDIQLSLRVRDVSRMSDSWGTSLPIVREERFSDALSIIDIPVTADFRQTLRIYGLDPADSTLVRVRLYGRNENPTDPTQARQDEKLGEITLALMTDPSPNKIFPPFVEIQSLAGIAPLGSYKRVRVDVTSLGIAKKVWAFVSVTANSTQHVTILEPRPGL